MKEVTILNEQEAFPITVDLFESLGHTLMDRFLELNTFQLGVHLVTADRMAEVNWDYLKHEGPTDVITFDHSEMEICDEETDLYGELFICPEIARTQAKEFSQLGNLKSSVTWFMASFISSVSTMGLPKKRTR